MNLSPKIGFLITSVKNSRLLSLLTLFLIIAAVPLTVFIAQQQQELRQKAAPLSSSEPTNLRMYCITNGCSKIRAYWEPPTSPSYWRIVKLYNQDTNTRQTKWTKENKLEFDVNPNQMHSFSVQSYSSDFINPPYSPTCNLASTYNNTATGENNQGDCTGEAGNQAYNYYNSPNSSEIGSQAVRTRQPYDGEGNMAPPTNLFWECTSSTCSQVKLYWLSQNPPEIIPGQTGHNLIRVNKAPFDVWDPGNTQSSGDFTVWWTGGVDRGSRGGEFEIVTVTPGSQYNITVQHYLAESGMTLEETYIGALRSAPADFGTINTQGSGNQPTATPVPVQPTTPPNSSLLPLTVSTSCDSPYGYLPTATISWTDNADESQNQYYKVWRKGGNEDWVTRVNLTGVRTHFTDSSFSSTTDSTNSSNDQTVRANTAGLAENTAYTYYLEIVRPNQQSLYSVEKTITTPTTCGPQITVDWNPQNACTDTYKPIAFIGWNEVNSGSPRTGEYYKLYRSGGGSSNVNRVNLVGTRRHFNDSSFSSSQNSTNSDNTQTVLGGSPGLLPNTQYTYWIEVEDGNPLTPLRTSNKVTGTTAACSTSSPTPTSVVNNPTATPITSNPTATPVPGGGNPTSTPIPGASSLAVKLSLRGISKQSCFDSTDPKVKDACIDNANPQRKNRQATLCLYPSGKSPSNDPQCNNGIKIANLSLAFDIPTQKFGNASISLPATVTTGSYDVLITVEGFLRTRLTGLQTITQGQATTLPEKKLISMDLNGDNQLNVLDYNLFIGCYKGSTTCTSSIRNFADFNDDGLVNNKDQIIFAESFRGREGD